jgi:predicted GNAT family N-acyltransferase
MSDVPEFFVQVGTWSDPNFKELASFVRQQVFVLEQNVPLEQELDEQVDAECIHALAFDFAACSAPVGVGRLLPDGHIGRMAVLRDYRGKGVGEMIMLRLMDEARLKRYEQVVLNAQTHALGFYQRFGFIAEGDEYLEANIPHRTMRCKLY